MDIDGIRISELTEKTQIQGSEYFAVSDSGESKKIKISKLQTKLQSGIDIKTYNGISLLGKGNIDVDVRLDNGSSNAVRNSTVTNEIVSIKNNIGADEYPIFDKSNDYHEGDVVRLEGSDTLYRFTVNHIRGGEFDIDEVEITNLVKELSDKTSGEGGGAITTEEIDNIF